MLIYIPSMCFYVDVLSLSDKLFAFDILRMPSQPKEDFRWLHETVLETFQIRNCRSYMILWKTSSVIGMPLKPRVMKGKTPLNWTAWTERQPVKSYSNPSVLQVVVNKIERDKQRNASICNTWNFPTDFPQKNTSNTKKTYQICQLFVRFLRIV